MQVIVGQPATLIDLALNFLLGFLLGYKIVALFIMSNSATEDPQQFIFSTIGSWPAGIGLGLLFAGLKWWDKHKQKLAKPEKRTVRIWPHDRVGEITILALVFGLLGAKIFDIFENWGDFKATIRLSFFCQRPYFLWRTDFSRNCNLVVCQKT
jgi:hypothetical protein